MPCRGLLILLKMLLVSGGYRADIGDSTSTTEIYDPELGNWRSGASLPSQRIGLRAVNIDGRVLIFGINVLLIKIFRKIYEAHLLFTCRWYLRSRRAG